MIIANITICVSFEVLRVIFTNVILASQLTDDLTSNINEQYSYASEIFGIVICSVIQIIFLIMLLIRKINSNDEEICKLRVHINKFEWSITTMFYITKMIIILTIESCLNMCLFPFELLIGVRLS